MRYVITDLKLSHTVVVIAMLDATNDTPTATGASLTANPDADNRYPRYTVTPERAAVEFTRPDGADEWTVRNVSMVGSGTDDVRHLIHLDRPYTDPVTQLIADCQHQLPTP